MAYKIRNRKKLYLTMLADMVGSVICALPKLLKSKEPIISENIGKILVIRTAYVGDVVMTLPVLKPLKDRFPGASITFLTGSLSEPLLRNNPYVDEVMVYDPFWFYASPKSAYREFLQKIKPMQFDLVIEARGDIREFLFLVSRIKARHKVSSGIGGGTYFLTHVVPGDGLNHRVDYHLDMARFVGCRTDGLEWGVYLTAGEKAATERVIAENGLRQGFIASHPGTRAPLKKWDEARYAALYDTLIEELGIPVVVVGTESERESAQQIIGHMKNKAVNLAGRLNLRELAGLLEKARLFVCNDSAPMHIAASMKTPVVALFGPSKSRETGPYGTKHRVVEKDFACRFNCDETTCTHSEHNACMKAIQVEDVLAAVRDLMKEVR